MRFDLIDKNGKLFGFLDSEKNKELETMKIIIVSNAEGRRYFVYDALGFLLKENRKFVEADVMSCFFSEVEHDGNDHTKQENT